METQEDNRYKEIPFDKIAATYVKKGGMVAAVCEELGVSRQTWYRWLEEYPDLKDLIDEVWEGYKDMAENQLLVAIQQGDRDLLKFFLKTKAKDRGYTEKTEVKHDVSGEVHNKHEFNVDDIRAIHDQLENDY